jgi:ABC-type multidrug transport system fused ATPase/permease subunit
MLGDSRHTPDTLLPTGVLIRRLLRLAWQFKSGCIKVLSLQIVLLILGLLGLGLTGLGIDYLRHQILPSAPPPHWPFGIVPPAGWSPTAVVASIAAAILGFATLRALLNYNFSVQFAILLQGEIVVYLRSKVFKKLQSLSFRFFDDNASGSIINRVTGDVQSTRLFIDGVIMQSLIMLLSLSFYLCYMLSIHVKLTLLCLSTTPLIWLLTSRFSNRMRPAYQRNRELVDTLILALSETIQGIHVVKGFAREPELTARFAEANRHVRDQKRWMLNKTSFYTPLIGFSTQLNLMILLAYGGYLAIRGDLPLGAGLVVFAGLLQQFSDQVANIANLANSAQESLTSARRVFEVLDAPVDIQSPPHAIRLPTVRGAVTFEQVSFGYESNLRVLQDISFEAQAGQRIAVVGPAGSGKSTLLSLIPRFYDPQHGCVRIDGHKLTDINLNDLRHSVAMVFQESFLFSNTIAANIAFGNPGADIGAIREAARIAGAHNFIMEYPQGYDTILREGGADLSGGQRQRLAIARAILLNPSILMLDDPTAAIDSQTEHEILAAMDSAMQGRTTFIVAHRISTLQKADKILILDHGRLIQTGTHEELIRTRGPYQRLAALQMVDDESLKVLSSKAPAPRGPPSTPTGGVHE